MKEDQFDKRLVEKMKAALEGYEPPYDPDAWADLRGKLGHQPNTGRPFALLALLGTLLIFSFFELNPIQNTDGPALGVWAALSVEETTAAIMENDTTSADHAGSFDLQPTEVVASVSAPLSGKLAAGQQVRKQPIPEAAHAAPKGEELPESPLLPEEPTLPLIAAQRTTPEKEALPALETDQNLAALPLLFPEPSRQAAIDLVTVNQGKANPYQFQRRHLMFSAVAQGALHYNQRVQFGEAGAGAGLLAHIPISRQFRLSTGAMWVHQSGKFIPGQERFIFQSIQSEALFFNTSRGNRNDFIAGPDFTTMIGQGTTVDLVTITGRLQTLEVPMLFTYYLPFRKKKQWYITTGLSGYVHLKETYQYRIETFISPSSMVPMPPSLTETERVFGPFESGNFASTLYIGAGFEKARGVYSSWGLEPYVKLPLAGMGVEALPVRSLGIRLRYNFALPLKLQ